MSNLPSLAYSYLVQGASHRNAREENKNAVRLYTGVYESAMRQVLRSLQNWNLEQLRHKPQLDIS